MKHNDRFSERIPMGPEGDSRFRAEEDRWLEEQYERRMGYDRREEEEPRFQKINRRNPRKLGPNGRR